MKITENLMLGKLLLNRPVYEALEAGSFKPVLCTDTTNPSSIQTFSQFTDGTYHPWDLQRCRKVPTITNTKVARHKVYNEEELEFLINYEELEDLSLDVLQYLAEDHVRCSFVVNGDTFLRLFGQLAMLTGSFKYNSNIYNRENCFSRLAQNSMFVISMYKLNTFIFDLYGNKPSGYGVAFEVVDKLRSTVFPEITVGYYILLTDAYEGVFYVDGKSVLPIKSTDFKRKYEYFKRIVEICDSAAARELSNESNPIRGSAKKPFKAPSKFKPEVDWAELASPRARPQKTKALGDYEAEKVMAHTEEAIMDHMEEASKKAIGMSKKTMYTKMYSGEPQARVKKTYSGGPQAKKTRTLVGMDIAEHIKNTTKPFKTYSEWAEEYQNLDANYVSVGDPDTNDLDFDVEDLEVNHMEFSSDDEVEVVPEEVQPEPAPAHKKKNQDPRLSMADRYIKTARKSSRSNTAISQATFATVYQDNFSTVYKDSY